METRVYVCHPETLVRNLAKILEKLYANQDRVVIRCDTPEQATELNNQLWTYHPSSFLPHGIGENLAEEQPIWLTDDERNLNAARTIILMPGASTQALNHYDHCIEWRTNNNFGKPIFIHENQPWRLWSQEANGQWQQL